MRSKGVGRGRTRAAGVLIAGLVGGSPALGAEAPFQVPVAPLPQALTAFALQAGISIGLNAAAACRAPKAPLVGRFEVEAGLARLLEGTGCGFRRLDARAYEVVHRPEAAAPAVVSTPAELGPVIVVATRRPSPAARLAYPVSAVDRDELQARGATDLGAIATLVPAMTITNLGPGRDKVLLRGLSDGPLTGRAQAMVGLYLDGMRLTYNAPDPDLRLEDVAQVEVLRGPQGALYGAGSVGGVIRMVTREPDAGAASGYLRAGISATEGGAPSNLVAGMVNRPFAGGAGAVRAVAYSETTGGWLDGPARARDLNSTSRLGGRASIRLDLGGSWSLAAGVVGQSIASRDAQYVIAGGPGGRPTAVREPHDNDFTAIHLDLEGRPGGNELRASLAAIDHRLVSRYDATLSSLVPAGQGASTYDDDEGITTLLAEVTLSGGEDDRSGWLLGGFAAASRQDTRMALALVGGGPVLWSERRRDNLSEFAVFGEVTRPIGETLAITLGGRLSASHNDADSRTVAAGTPPARFQGDLSRWRFAPKAQIAWRPTAWALAYVEAAEGYRFGGFNTSGPPGQAFSQAGGAPPRRLYRDDELWSLEAGARLDLFDARLTLRAAAFAARWKAIQSDQLLPSGQTYTANLGDGGNRGVELEARYSDGGWTWTGALLVNGPEFTRLDAMAGADLALAGVPDLAGSVGLRRAWDVGAGRAELAATVGYVGASRLTFGPSLQPRMGDYVTSRLDLSWRTGAWRAAASVDNLAGSRGDTFAYGNPFSLRAAPQATPQRPRTVGLEITRSF